MECGPSAAGLDSLTYADFRYLPPIACVNLVNVLRLVEQGHPWPQQLLHARAHMLSKDPSTRFDPLAYRLLLITPVIYRAWAKLRLKHLQSWIGLWALPNIFGGIQGFGADEAWYSTAIDLEWALTSCTLVVGGALDLFKCFGQILRPLLYMVLRLAGLPEEILVAYMNYQEQMLIYNSFSGSIGQPHQHPAGIPQG